MSASEFATTVPGFFRKKATEQIIILAWHAQAHAQRSAIDGAYMRLCFAEIGLAAPDMSVYLPRLAARKPPQLVRSKDGTYRLAPGARQAMDTRYGTEPTAQVVAQALTNLPSRLPDLREREFLNETLKCYRAGAFRAAIVMAWNLTYDHLASIILQDPMRLCALNSGIELRYPKKNLVVSKREDLENLKESEFVEAL
jgi:hypothetical protein